MPDIARGSVLSNGSVLLPRIKPRQYHNPRADLWCAVSKLVSWPPTPARRSQEVWGVGAEQDAVICTCEERGWSIFPFAAWAECSAPHP